MAITVKLGGERSIVVSGGTPEDPIVASIQLEKSKFDVVDFGSEQEGYVCESSSPSDAIGAPKGKEVKFKHQHTGQTFIILGGD